ncbi:hypothetical protein ACUXVT_05775 [Acinetobacter soli]|uniref:hypothetical protein n=1 Tax=Acinetobacter soli TaxID=487316 RepID=UPI004056D19E
MNTILNAKEAFEALQNRKTVLCRYAGDGTLPGDKDFSPLDQMPATVFVMPHYEFCIKIETMELAGITFTKPLVPEDIRDQQEIYIVMPTCILRTKYDAEHTDVHNAVMNGFAQADADNALLQLKALCAVFGNAIESVEVKDGFEEKPKRQRKQRETKITVVDEEEKKSLEEPQQETVSIDAAFNDMDPNYFDEEDPNIKRVLISIESCKTEYYLDGVLANLNGNKDKFHDDEYQELLRRVSAKRESIINESQNSVTGLKNLQQNAIDEEYNKQLKELLEVVAKANTPEEANKVFRYTKKWTADQLKPLHAAVGRRLCELPQPETKEPPSLLVRIRNAPDLTELDALEIDVSVRDPKIVPTLMAEVNKRRKQLEAPVDLINEAFP